jgi:hypothetical protein
LLDGYNRWILIFLVSSEDNKSPQGDPFQVWQMQLPSQQNWKWSDALEATTVGGISDPRRHICASTLSDGYNGWKMIFLESSEDKNSPQGDPFQVWQMELPSLLQRSDWI